MSAADLGVDTLVDESEWSNTYSALAWTSPGLCDHSDKALSLLVEPPCESCELLAYLCIL